MLSAGKDESSKVAAGMEVSFVVTFRPESTEDYAYNLVVCTEREKFVVPVIAAGAAPALDLPDLVEFEPTPVKMPSSQVCVVHACVSCGGFKSVPLKCTRDVLENVGSCMCTCKRVGGEGELGRYCLVKCVCEVCAPVLVAVVVDVGSEGLIVWLGKFGSAHQI